jgi:hypothetical protein
MADLFRLSSNLKSSGVHFVSAGSFRATFLRGELLAMARITLSQSTLLIVTLH